MALNLPKLVEDYYVWSIAYYRQGRSLASDNMFDTCCKILLANYSKTPDSFKKLTTKSDLKCGTGMTLTYENLYNSVEADVCDAVSHRLENDREWPAELNY